MPIEQVRGGPQNSYGTQLAQSTTGFQGVHWGFFFSQNCVVGDGEHPVLGIGPMHL